MDNNSTGSFIKKMLPFRSTKTSQQYQMHHIIWNIERHVFARKGFSRLKMKNACLTDLQFQSGIIAEGPIYGILKEESKIELCDYT